MLNKEQTKYFLIARNYADRSKSEILIEDIPPDFDKDDLRLDLSTFIGKGFWLEVRELSDLDGGDEFIFLKLEYNGELRTFVHTETISYFPLIEGTVESGIYRLDKELGHYYLLRHNRDLTNAGAGLDLGMNQNLKFVCRPDKLQMQWLDSADVLDVKRHPLSFFDLDCPFCGARLAGSRQDSEADPLCQTSEASCPHYAGYVARCGGEYERDKIETLLSEFRIEGSELFLLNSKGDFEKPIAISIPFSEDSYWNFSFENGSPFFLFINRDPSFDHLVPHQCEITVKYKNSSIFFDEK